MQRTRPQSNNKTRQVSSPSLTTLKDGIKFMRIGMVRRGAGARGEFFACRRIEERRTTTWVTLVCRMAIIFMPGVAVPVIYGHSYRYRPEPASTTDVRMSMRGANFPDNQDKLASRMGLQTKASLKPAMVLAHF
ncbi:hypothetical protein IW262DRAFT_1494705 [Armillaria fumosa]|nr:hypothetical protein IW262DRAFT_1494705 [Armillaria fumosa]